MYFSCFKQSFHESGRSIHEAWSHQRKACNEFMMCSIVCLQYLSSPLQQAWEFLQMPGWHDYSETTKAYFPVVSWMRCSLSFVTLHSTIVLFLPPPSSKRCGNSQHNLVSLNPVHSTPCAPAFISCPLHSVTKNLLADLVNQTQSAMLNPAGVKAPHYSLATEPLTCNIIQDKYSFNHAAA